MQVSKAGGGILSSTTAGISLMAAGLLLIPLNIRTVGADSYGVWIAMSVMATYLYYSDLGIGAAIIHFGSRSRSGLSVLTPTGLLSSGVAWNAAVSVIIVPVYILGVDYFMDSKFIDAEISNSDQTSLKIAGVMLLSAIIIKPFESALIGAGYMNYERRNQVAGAIMRVAGTVVACIVFGTVVAIAIAEAVALVTPPILSAVLVSGTGTVRLRIREVRFSTLKEMFHFSSRAFATGAVGALILQAGTVMAAYVGSPSDVTYFTAAFRLYSSVRQIISWITEPFRPLMSRIWTTDPEKAKSFILSYLLAATFVASVGCLALMYGAEDIIRLWLGESAPTHSVAATLIVLLIGLMLNIVHIPLVPALDGAGRPGAYLPLQILWLALYVLIGLTAGRALGIVGIAIGLTLPLIVLEPLYLIKANRTLNFGVQRWMREVLLPVGAIAASGAILTLSLRAMFEEFGLITSDLVISFIFGSLSITLLVVFRQRAGVNRLISALKVEL